MKRILRTFAIPVLLACCPLAGFAQAGSAEFPSIGTARGTIQIANRTSSEVVFYLTTKHTRRTEHRLAAETTATFTGEPGDEWFNIEVYTNVNGSRVQKSYGLDAGDRHYLAFNDGGALDVYKTSAPSGRTTRSRGR